MTTIILSDDTLQHVLGVLLSTAGTLERVEYRTEEVVKAQALVEQTYDQLRALQPGAGIHPDDVCVECGGELTPERKCKRAACPHAWMQAGIPVREEARVITSPTCSVTTGPIIDEKWNRSDFHCLRCGTREVWREAGEGDYYCGPSHLCLHCGLEFALPDSDFIGKRMDGRDDVSRDTDREILTQLRKHVGQI